MHMHAHTRTHIEVGQLCFVYCAEGILLNIHIIIHAHTCAHHQCAVSNKEA